jgi:hypothetical protein
VNFELRITPLSPDILACIPITMPTLSEAFGLCKTQAELDFVNIPLHTDIWLCLDPFAIGQRVDEFSRSCHDTLISFFLAVVLSLRNGDDREALRLLSQLREPNETRLGLSSKRPKGAGVGRGQAMQLLTALKGSAAVTTGFLASLEECELMIDGIGRDKISDLTTNIIRSHLIQYTQQQCVLHGVPLQSVATAPCFNGESIEWISGYADLPVWEQKPIILVPKVFVRIVPAYNHQKYYQHFVLDFLQAEELNAGSSLVQSLKKGRRVVYKKDLEAKYPCSKEFLYEFSKAHPEVLEQYRTELKRLELGGKISVVDDEDETLIAAALATALVAVPKGSSGASEYHRLMIGVIEFVFFPSLFNPVKELEIHEGRKRIDIVVENCARNGIFHRLHDVRALSCSLIPIECKNYAGEIANPELDQLSGRFSERRGQVGVLCCRNFDDRALFVKRCQDTFSDGRGLILPVDDQMVLGWLESIGKGQRAQLETHWTELVNEIWL